MKNTQQCTKCFVIKLLDDYHQYRNASDEFKYKKICKKCIAVYDRERNIKNKEKILKQQSDYRKKNRERINIRNRARHHTNKEELNAKSRVRYHANPENQLKSSRKWVSKNINEVRKHKTNYSKRRRKIDPQFKLAERLRGRVRSAIKNKNKVGSGVQDLGCTLEELKIYFEFKFQPGMTWKNHGQFGWHIDHIKPLKDFDLSNRKQFLKACHYTNLQPLWWNDNLNKNRKDHGTIKA